MSRVAATLNEGSLWTPAATDKLISGSDSRVARFGPSIPTRAGRLADASVDPTDARKLAGFGPADRVVRRGGNLIIRLRAPRPSRRRLWHQPGLAACAAATLGVALKALDGVLSYHTGLGNGYLDMKVLWFGWPYSGPAVAGAWLARIVTGRWRAERSGIDRLGRLIGVCWLIQFVLGQMPGIRWAMIHTNLFYRWSL
jgi:hypothetical protein